MTFGIFLFLNKQFDGLTSTSVFMLCNSQHANPFQRQHPRVLISPQYLYYWTVKTFDFFSLCFSVASIQAGASSSAFLGVFFRFSKNP